MGLLSIGVATGLGMWGMHLLRMIMPNGSIPAIFAVVPAMIVGVAVFYVAGFISQKLGHPVSKTEVPISGHRETD